MAVDPSERIARLQTPGAPLSRTAVDPNPAIDDPNNAYAYEPSTNRLARGVATGTVVERKDTGRRRDVAQALSSNTWDEPESPFGASYPHNQVFSTPNGLIQEFDDTPNNIRYHLYHPSGSYTEVDNNGTEVRKIVGDNYYIVENNGNIFIGGTASVTVQNTCKILVLGDANIEVSGKFNAVVKNDISFTASGSINLNAGETFNIRAENIVMESTNFDHTTVGNQTVKTNKLSLNIGDSYNLQTGTSFNIQSDIFNLTTTGVISQKSAGDMSLSSQASIKIKGDSSTSVNSGGDLKLGGSVLHLNPGTIKATSTAVVQGTRVAPVQVSPTSADNPSDPTAPTVAAPTFTNLLQPGVRSLTNEVASPPVPRPNSRSQRAAIENDGLSGPVSRSLYPGYNSTPPHFNSSDTAPTRSFTPVTGVTVNPRFENITTPPYEELISKYVRLKDVTINAATRGHRIPEGGWLGLSMGQIVTNLQALSENVIDKIIEKYGTSVILLSGFRQQENASQHAMGEAIDIRFSNLPANQYQTRAAQLIEEIPFDQLIAEYQTGGSGLPWIHISYKNTGNRRQYFTMMDHRRVSPISVA